MTNLILHRWARFGWAERPQIWFWLAFAAVANDNTQQRELFG